MADTEELLRRLRKRHNPDFSPRFGSGHHRLHHQEADRAADTIERLSSGLAAAQKDYEQILAEGTALNELLVAAHQREEQMRRALTGIMVLVKEEADGYLTFADAYPSSIHAALQEARRALGKDDKP